MDDGNTEALKKVEEELQRSKEKQKFTMELKNGVMIAVTKGTRVVLESSYFQTSLEVPEGVTAVVKHKINTGLKSIRETVPRKECLVSPIVHFHITELSSTEIKPKFKATVPHVASSDQLSSLKVKSGDIRSPESMQDVKKGKQEKKDEPYFEVHPNTVTLNANSVCDIMCTSDQKMCTSKILAVPFGLMEIEEIANQSENDIKLLTYVKVKTFLCNHLYSYPSYRDVSMPYILHYKKLSLRIR